jgi:hypothetical protein
VETVKRIEQKVDSTKEEVDVLKKKDSEELPQVEDVLKPEKDDDDDFLTTEISGETETLIFVLVLIR